MIKKWIGERALSNAAGINDQTFTAISKGTIVAQKKSSKVSKEKHRRGFTNDD